MFTMRKIYIVLLVVPIFLAGCGGNVFQDLSDLDSQEAKKEAAKIALDKGDYSEAITLLEGLCGTDTSSLTCDEEAQADLASAYVASATGLDVLQLIAKAEEASASTTESFTTVSTLLPIEDINNCATDTTSCTLTTEMDNAITILDGLLPDTVPANPTETEKNLYLQLAVASAVDAAVNVGIVSGGLDPTTGVPSSSPGSVDSSILQDITTDVNNIVIGVEGSGLVSSELTSDINNIKSGMDSDGSGDVSQTELQSYIDNLRQ